MAAYYFDKSGPLRPYHPLPYYRCFVSKNKQNSLAVSSNCTYVGNIEMSSSGFTSDPFRHSKLFFSLLFLMWTFLWIFQQSGIYWGEKYRILHKIKTIFSEKHNQIILYQQQSNPGKTYCAGRPGKCPLEDHNGR